MLSQEILAQVRRIEILAGRLVTETLAGQYHSVFKGQGMEFAEVREYSPGDDVRAIDWNVTARTGRPYVRRYVEERELTVAVACDLSGSQAFASRGRLKKEIAAELSAVLAFSALQNNDKAGLFLFTEEVEAHFPPKKGRRHALHLIREVLAYQPKRRGTAIGRALETMTQVLKRRCILFLISDFLDEGFQRPLRLAARKHDVIPIVLVDPLEERLPAMEACLDLEDPETGRRILCDARPDRPRQDYARGQEQRRKSLENLFAGCGLDTIRIKVDEPYLEPLIRFFQQRALRLRH